MNIIKILGLVTLFKDVTEEYQKAGKEGRPWYAQRTVWGAIGVLVMGLASAILGVTLDTAAVESIFGNIPQLITVAGTIWSAALMVFGAVMKGVKALQEK